MIRVGIIGYGYWGPNLVRNFADDSNASVRAISDRRADRLSIARHRYPFSSFHPDPAGMIADPDVDAIVVATPVDTHYDLALAALKAGKHVLVTKPLASTSEQVLRLIEEAEKRRRVLMVDSTFIYTGAVRKLRELVASGELGDVYYYDSVRVNLGLFQHDVNVIWDLAVHDLSIMDYALGKSPKAVSATGVSHVGGLENIAYLTLFFEKNLIGHVHVNWLSPVKVRRTLIGGSRRMIVYDDLEPSEKIKVYDRGVSVAERPEQIYELLVHYRLGDMWAPAIDIAEGLKVEVAHFIDCVANGKKPLTDGRSGLRTVSLMEAACRSLSERGRPVEL